MNLLYVVDPMCSWCYGFAKPMDALLAQPGPFAPLQLALVMGGLRPYTTDPTPPERADELAGHWRHVAEASGQPFAQAPHTALHQPGFVYDTEPASRAVITVRTHWPKLVWRYLKAVQHAFYAEGRNVVQPEVLADVAEGLGIARADFARHFASQEMRDAARADFSQAQAWGIRGFPALIAEHGDHLHLVAQGYMPIETLRERLDAVSTAHD
ncbi:MAG: DsbA family protein [Rhizobacter sp.]|nr:DsbA family protein [Rhizobacter sp.]